jgi:SAM-dependent methyltransferase
MLPSDSVGRFTGLSSLYAKHRPSYPSAAIEYIVAHCGLTPGSVLIDVGCGTGIAARLFSARGLDVIGIEPNAEMRTQAVSESADGGPRYRDGSAEATGIDDGSADAVLAAQAFHWFRAEAALGEFHRILKPGGWVVLMWNERDAHDPCTAAYGAVVRGTPEAAALEHQRSHAGDVLLSHPRFVHAQRVVFRNTQELDEDGLLGRAFSVSYAPRDPERAERYAADLRAVFERFERVGKVVLHYKTAVTTAQKQSE